MANFESAVDMVDGGGAGASGPEFKGGDLSTLANKLGIRPYGWKPATAAEEEEVAEEVTRAVRKRAPASPISFGPSGPVMANMPPPAPIAVPPTVTTPRFEHPIPMMGPSGPTMGPGRVGVFSPQPTQDEILSMFRGITAR